MHISGEKYPILHRVDGPIGLRGRRSSDPMTVVKIIPVLLISQRKYMDSFEDLPETDTIYYSWRAGDSASQIPVTYRVIKGLNPGSRWQRERTK